MYSVILMTVVSTGGEVMDCGRHHRGRAGCGRADYGAVTYGGCYGAVTYGGCYGAVTYGGECVSGAPLLDSGVPTSVPPPADRKEDAKKASRVHQNNKEMEIASLKLEGGRKTPSSARVIVDVPHNARLYINGELHSARAFRTPALESGKPYHYTMTVETDVNGHREARTKYVQVTAGDEVAVSFRPSDSLIAARP